MKGLILWVAQGFGVGRSPFAPGTLGSGIGLIWFAGLLATGNLVAFGLVVCVSLGLSIWLCGAAEDILKQTDPGSIVLDEIVAMPVCFVGWLIGVLYREGVWPPPERLLNATTWPLVLVVFGLFRLFDVLKPWPVRQSQRLPGGWGVTVDDLLAAGYVNLCVLGLKAVTPLADRW